MAESNKRACRYSGPFRFVHLGLRTTQLLVAIVIAGIYGHDLHTFSSTNQSAPASWIYAIVVAALSFVGCIIQSLLGTANAIDIILDFTIAILWTALFGNFASIIWHHDDQEVDFELDTSAMRAAVWIDMIGMVLWLASCCFAIYVRLSGRRQRKRASLTPLLGKVEEQSPEEHGCIRSMPPTYEPVQDMRPACEKEGKPQPQSHV